MATKKYPRMVYVQKEKDCNSADEILLAWDDAGEANDGKLAIYKFVKMVNKETKTILTIK